MDKQLGFGVMLSMLSGNETTVKAYKAAQAKKIAALCIDDAARDDGALQILFTDGSGVDIYDNGRSCCEHRYMHTDDTLEYYAGSKFLNVEVEDGPDATDSSDDYPHEQQFLKVTTSKGVFTIVTHNEHNGYYGGFAVCMRYMEKRNGKDKVCQEQSRPKRKRKKS